MPATDGPHIGSANTTNYASHKEYFRQSIYFIAKGMYVTLTVTIPGRTGVPKSTMVSLATSIVSKPIEKLKDP